MLPVKEGVRVFAIATLLAACDRGRNEESRFKTLADDACACGDTACGETSAKKLEELRTELGSKHVAHERALAIEEATKRMSLCLIKVGVERDAEKRR